jgi:hypothetical protein
MRIMGRGPVLALIGALVLASGPAWAERNPNGQVFSAVGWWKGKSEVTAGQIKCEIPSVNSAIGDGAFSVGLWNTYGFQTIYFPDINQPFANPCGAWLQLRSNMRDQGLNIQHIELSYRIPGANRFRQFVVTRGNFPVACRELRRDTIYTGMRLNPVNSTQESSSSGAPNVGFLQVLPLVSPQMFSCLRSQYAGIPTDVLVSMPLVIRAVVVATADSGKTYQSNPAKYTLNLRHMCGNGRLDDGEQCDPNEPQPCLSECLGGFCASNSAQACTSPADCVGTCVAQDNPSECTCLF